MKKLIAAVILATTIPLTYAANIQSNDMNISNGTNINLSFSVNGVCTPELGIVAAHTVKTVPHRKLSEACRSRMQNCEVVLFKTLDCIDKPIAAVVMDVSGSGATRIYPVDGAFNIGASGFNIFVAGSWR